MTGYYIRRKVDNNQQDIVATLRRLGCSVQSLASLGHGVPDLLVGFRGRNILLEVKNGALPPSARGLTEKEQGWHDKWNGEVLTVHNEEEALEAVGLIGP